VLPVVTVWQPVANTEGERRLDDQRPKVIGKQTADNWWWWCSADSGYEGGTDPLGGSQRTREYRPWLDADPFRPRRTKGGSSCRGTCATRPISPEPTTARSAVSVRPGSRHTAWTPATGGKSRPSTGASRDAHGFPDTTALTRARLRAGCGPRAGSLAGLKTVAWLKWMASTAHLAGCVTPPVTRTTRQLHQPPGASRLSVALEPWKDCCPKSLRCMARTRTLSTGTQPARFATV
jgi:hypothetical protein